MGEVMNAREVVIREMNSLRGRLLTAIESIGLPPKQEKNLVTLIKNLSYQNQGVIVEVIDRIDNGEAQFEYLDVRLAQVERVEV